MKKANIYLISPPDFNLEHFSYQLETALKTGKVAFFQLRLKKTKTEQIISSALKLLPICHKYKTRFIINDNIDLALQIGADGVHLGGEDGNITEAKKKGGKNFIVSVSCYDSKQRALDAQSAGADYVSFGTFFPSKTKNSIGKPTTEILKWCKKNLNLPCIAIGGINDQNYQPLIEAGADYLAIISYIWQNEKGVKYAINSIINK